jgi:hypothetical protein
MVAHASISATQQAEIQRIKVQIQPGQKVSKTLSQQISHVQWHTCNPNYSEGMNRRRSSNSSPRDVPEGCESAYNTGTCTPMFIAALFTITKI